MDKELIDHSTFVSLLACQMYAHEFHLLVASVEVLASGNDLGDLNA